MNDCLSSVDEGIFNAFVETYLSCIVLWIFCIYWVSLYFVEMYQNSYSYHIQNNNVFSEWLPPIISS